MIINYEAKWLLPIRFLLIPFSILYGAVLQGRNWLYDRLWLKSRRFQVPVISIGNLSAGGSGKTPVTIFLAQKLSEQYGSVAVVSRGYGRKSKGPLLVSDGKRLLISVEQAGDEPALIARKTGAIVAVAEQRSQGIKLVLKNFSPSFILLDDGFQHRSVARDVDILLVNARESTLDRFPLPAGYYREFSFNARRADVIIMTNTREQGTTKFRGKFWQPILEARFDPGVLIAPDFKTAMPLETLKGKTAGVFCGIAHPEAFREGLEAEGISPAFFEPYSDHKRYSVDDLEVLVEKCTTKKCRYLLCTEKDLVKIAELDLKIMEENKIQLLTVTQKVRIMDFEKLQKKLKQLIDKSE